MKKFKLRANHPDTPLGRHANGNNTMNTTMKLETAQLFIINMCRTYFYTMVDSCSDLENPLVSLIDQPVDYDFEADF